MEQERTYTAFAGDRQLASGPLRELLLAVKALVDRQPVAALLIFDDQTGQQVEFDFRGTPEQVLAREAPEAKPSGPGRPRIGVVSREVTLLPRHWEWLEAQPNGISAALRRLVDEAAKREPGKERARRLRDATSRVMTALAGNSPGYEEASRALFAGQQQEFERRIRAFPKDIRKHLERLSRECERLRKLAS
jgi:hypothetical protein